MMHRQYVHMCLTHPARVIIVQIRHDIRMVKQPADTRFKRCTIWTQITTVSERHAKQPCYPSGTVLYNPRTKQHNNSFITSTADSK